MTAPTPARLGAVQIAALLAQHRPTDEQVAIIEAPLEPLLVVAGAGSGKTETMAARVVYLVANGLVEPERVLGLTFTRKAAGELSERIRRRLRALRRARSTAGQVRPSTLVVPVVSTYNSYAAGLVADHALRLGLEPSAQLLGEAGRWQLAHEIVEQWTADLDVDLAPSTITTAVLDLAGSLAEHVVDPRDLRSTVEALARAVAQTPDVGRTSATERALIRESVTSLRLRARLVDLVEEFATRKRAADQMDFADQVALAARLAAEVPDVGAGERSRFGVVLLDEYQDTSVAQLVLLRHLFGGAGDGAGHPVTAVGDPHQSIYGWRGASAGGLESFPEHFPSVGADRSPAPVLVLSTSWRNDHAVLAAANLIAAPLRTASGLALPELSPRAGAGAGGVATLYAETVEAEARAVAEFVAERRTALRAERAGTGGAAATPPVTAAVLCRKRSQFAELQGALLAAGLPVEVVGLGGLLSTPEVVDLVAALEAAHDPSRGDSLMRLLTGPRARLGLADLHALADWSAELADRDDRSIVDALDDLPRPGWVGRRGRGLSERGRTRLVDLGELLRTLRRQTFLPVVDLVAEAERLLGLDIEVAARPGISPGTARANLDAFRSVAASFGDGNEGGTLGAFLAWLDAAQREERGLEAPVGEMDPEAVQLLTVHAAKGLEWDVVAVPGLVERSFPTAPRTSGWIKDNGALPTALRGDRDSLPDVALLHAGDTAELARRLEVYQEEFAEHHLAEERRLAYVAVTRARRHLLVCGSWWRTGSRPTAPSVFFTELVPEVETGPSATTKPMPAPVAPLTWPRDAEADTARQGRLAAAADAVRTALALDGAADTPPEDAGRAGPSSDLTRLVDLLLDERRRRRSERSTVALPAHLSASALVRLAADPQKFALQLRRPVPLAPSRQARRGTEFHAWVEGYFGSAALVDVDTMPGADDDSVTPDVELAALQARFLASPWADRTPIAVEVDIETPVGDVVIRSRIDAVFDAGFRSGPDAGSGNAPGGGAVVIDWKTGRPPTDVEEVRTRELQLAVYRLAWSRWRGVPLENVQAAFFYVATGETVWPTRLLGAQEIESVITATRTQSD